MEEYNSDRDPFFDLKFCNSDKHEFARVAYSTRQCPICRMVKVHGTEPGDDCILEFSTEWLVRHWNLIDALADRFVMNKANDYQLNKMLISIRREKEAEIRAMTDGDLRDKAWVAWYLYKAGFERQLDECKIFRQEMRRRGWYKLVPRKGKIFETATSETATHPG